jgi:hypothetical protein
MASYTSISDATNQELSTFSVEQLTTELIATLTSRLEYEKSRLEEEKAGRGHALDLAVEFNDVAQQLLDRNVNSEREVVRLKEEAETLKREVRRLEKVPKENADHLAHLTRAWLASKHASTDGHPEGEDMDDFVVLKLIKDMLSNHGVSEWARIDMRLTETIDELAENKDEVIVKLANAEEALSAAKDEVEQLEIHNELLLFWSRLTGEEKQRVVKRFVAVEQKAAAAQKIEAMKAEHMRQEKQLSERLLDAEKRASAAEQELAILKGKHINEKKNDTGGPLAASSTMGQIPHRQTAKEPNDGQSDVGASQLRGVQSNKRKATEQGSAETSKKPRDGAFRW